MIASNHGIRSTNLTGVGTIGGMYEGPRGDDDSIDGEGLFDVVFEEVFEEPGPQIECEEAPIHLPSNSSDPTSEERERQQNSFAAPVFCAQFA